jgi:predicted metalloenzyme YecM
MDVNEHKRLSNITLRHKVKEKFVVRNDMDINEHERLSNITLRHKVKEKFVHLHPYHFLLQTFPLLYV